MNVVVLSNDTWTLRLAPQWGGRIAELSVAGMDLLIPLRSNTFDPMAWPKAGAYPLMPYSNRLRNARLRVATRTYELPAHPAAHPHTLHGVGHTQAWQVAHCTRCQVTLTCTYTGEHWPWPIQMEQSYELSEEQLTMRLRVHNAGRDPMPAGLGLHPYFKRHPGMRVCLKARRDWQLDADYLSTGVARTVNAPLVLESDHNTHTVAHYLSEWDRHLQIDYVHGQLALQASEVLTHFVVFSPQSASYLCLEPVSHLADAFNSPAEAWPQTGTRLLAPGEALEGTLVWAWTATR